VELRARIWAHYERGGEAAPLEADRPGVVNSGMFFFEMVGLCGGGRFKCDVMC
jgi:hypothetical protein